MVATSINDCILRSRKEAEYVISSDLDEVIVVYEASSLSHFLHNLQKKYESFQNHWANISNPNEIDFSNFANILLENYTWPKGSRSKIIVRPEYVYSAHVHDVLSVDRGKLITTVSPKTARVFHLRRIMQDKLLSSKSVMKTNALARFVNPCNKSWKNRLQTIQQLPDVKILHGNTWPQRGVQVMKELENCRVQLQSVQNCSCNSIYLCSSKITSVDTDEWVLGKQAWTTL
ncbi:unnamed protein product [Thelazia callipaeda]|uniref:Glycosyltransferase family 92 protein n=1 Tax=Thelazia callipaeda TaxID=103827 RepID=A0A0N5CUZ8_THECL|nr:unnamed protein product [Thelazia callipaeda]